MNIEVDKNEDFATDYTFRTRRTPSPFPETDPDLEELGRVFKSTEFRTAAITTVVGGVVAANSDSTIIKAAGVAALMYGGFKIIDSFLKDGSIE
ncbi:hypothetical protein [Thorsellia anophelis]|uniref:Uncharacterized protein n=1 Tax=Thorsellia anophelis DSM 18579 TaxID=1123402 RepID=A0A1I0D2A3_9GAMM|nr:hypothetical protein [Thorsellia anophelis]SET26063.1 hypothetical protein SAMN02583745_01826 [Thorsellia anophelis DSM 18579]